MFFRTCRKVWNISCDVCESSIGDDDMYIQTRDTHYPFPSYNKLVHQFISFFFLSPLLCLFYAISARKSKRC